MRQLAVLSLIAGLTMFGLGLGALHGAKAVQRATWAREGCAARVPGPAVPMPEAARAVIVDGRVSWAHEY